MNPRTDGGIALCETGNAEGTWYVYSLGTGKVIKRNKFNILPMPDIVIDHFNSMCEKENRSVRKEPLFEAGTSRTRSKDEQYVQDDYFDKNTARKFAKEFLGQNREIVKDIVMKHMIRSEKTYWMSHTMTSTNKEMKKY
jgi:hypothetical protein